MTSTNENCIHQTSEHLEVRQIQPENQVAHPEHGCPVCAVVRAEMWGVTATDLNKLGMIHGTCLRRVLGRFWPNHLSNEELQEGLLYFAK